MSATADSPSSSFAAALALQEEHGRDYAALADKIRAESPETASILLTMRQRQAAQLRQLMCIYGFSSQPASARAAVTKAGLNHSEATSKDQSADRSANDPLVKRKLFVLHVVQPALAGLM